MKDKHLFYAVNGCGQGCVFVHRPYRDEHLKIWVGEMDGLYSSLVMQFESEGFELPVLRWRDEPVELELSLKVC